MDTIDCKFLVLSERITIQVWKTDARIYRLSGRSSFGVVQIEKSVFLELVTRIVEERLPYIRRAGNGSLEASDEPSNIVEFFLNSERVQLTKYLEDIKTWMNC